MNQLLVDCLWLRALDERGETRISSERIPNRIESQRRLGEWECAVGSREEPGDLRDGAIVFSHLRFNRREVFLHPGTENRIFRGGQKRDRPRRLTQGDFFVAKSRFAKCQTGGHERTLRLLLAQLIQSRFGCEIGLFRPLFVSA